MLRARICARRPGALQHTSPRRRMPRRSPPSCRRPGPDDGQAADRSASGQGEGRQGCRFMHPNYGRAHQKDGDTWVEHCRVCAGGATGTARDAAATSRRRSQRSGSREKDFEAADLTDELKRWSCSSDRLCGSDPQPLMFRTVTSALTVGWSCRAARVDSVGGSSSPGCHQQFFNVTHFLHLVFLLQRTPDELSPGQWSACSL